MIFIKLLMVHALCDFALQSDAMAYGKNRHNPPRNVPPGQKPINCWFYWLTSHALIHGLGVYLVTNNIWFGIGEVVVHWFIDLAKCENKTNIHQDQALHVLTKILWCF